MDNQQNTAFAEKVFAELEKAAQTNGIEFKASLYRKAQDGDGETKITLQVPRSDMRAMDVIGHWTEKPLRLVAFIDEPLPFESDAGDSESEDADDESDGN